MMFHFLYRGKMFLFHHLDLIALGFSLIALIVNDNKFSIDHRFVNFVGPFGAFPRIASHHSFN
jgi:hypothetical protein